MLACLAVEEHQLPAIGLEAWAMLRAVGDEPAVGRVRRPAIGRGVRRDLARLRGRIGQVDQEQVAVGADRLDRVGLLCERQFLRVGRERVVVRTSERERRHVGITWGDVARRGGTIGRHQEEVAEAAFLPRHPVAEHQAVEHAPLALPALELLEFLLVAPVRRALRVDVRREGDPPAVGRPDDA
jgi:hypothetical protein